MQTHSIKIKPSPAGKNREVMNIRPGGQLQPTTKLEEKWYNNLDLLIQFKQQHGHCLVPNRYFENPQLGAWVSVQRRQYKEFKQGKQTSMTRERAKVLESIGFKWSSKVHLKASWNARFEELKAHKAKYGNCLVPVEWNENPQLGVWVSIQRDAYHSKKNQNTNSISHEKIAKLDSIGFEWKIPSAGYAVPQGASYANMYSQASKTEPNQDMDLLRLRMSHDIAQRRLQISANSQAQQYLQGQNVINSRPDLVYRLAHINAMEDAVRLTMNRATIRNQQTASQRNISSVYRAPNRTVTEGQPTSGYFVDDDGKLIKKGGAKLMNPPVSNNNIVRARMNKIPSTTNSDIGTLPPLKGYSAAAANMNACRLVTEDSIENSNAAPDEIQAESKMTETKKSSKRASFISQRYPGPQTSDAFWWARYAELKKFREKNGHCIVPNRYPPHPPLGNWVSTQRRQYKLWKSDRTSSMNEERATALETIDFSWVVRSAYNMSIDSKKIDKEEEVERKTEKPLEEDERDIEHAKKSEATPKSSGFKKCESTSESTAHESKDDSCDEIQIYADGGSSPTFLSRTTSNYKKRPVEISYIDEEYFPYKKMVSTRHNILLIDSLKADSFPSSNSCKYEQLMSRYKREEFAQISESPLLRKEDDLIDEDEEQECTQKRYF